MRAHKQKSCFKPIIVLFATLAFIVYIVSDSSMNEYIKNRALNGVKAKATQTISQTVSNVLSDSDNEYNNYCSIIYDENKNVSSIEILSLSLSQMQAELANEIQSELTKLSECELEISLGDLSGFLFLFNRGFEITVKIDSIGSVICNPISEFTQAGVNQTCHSIYFDIAVDIAVVYPFECFETTVNVRYLAAQNIIVGAVPQMFAQV